MSTHLESHARLFPRTRCVLVLSSRMSLVWAQVSGPGASAAVPIAAADLSRAFVAWQHKAWQHTARVHELSGAQLGSTQLLGMRLASTQLSTSHLGSQQHGGMHAMQRSECMCDALLFCARCGSHRDGSFHKIIDGVLGPMGVKYIRLRCSLLSFCFPLLSSLLSSLKIIN